jgi:PPK2 family polyphosphate:nucleotide phosphotransferase
VRDRARQILEEDLAALYEMQERLWAADQHAVLIVLQAMDTAGKDGMIKHVMGGLNPQGCEVHNFKQPSLNELDHTFLWRNWVRTPSRGKIGIFNRSHYEEVLVARVHPEILDRSKLPPGKRGTGFWKKRYDDINAFEHHLTRNGTLVLKFFLHISKEEQRERLLARLENPDKHWKFSLSDLAERKFWNAYMKAYEAMFEATSTSWAPWYVIPANHKWVARTAVANILTDAIRKLDLKYPEVTDEQRAKLEDAKTALQAEGS